MLGAFRGDLGSTVATTHIPHLKKKLELLRTYGQLKTHEAHAQAFGVSASTVRWWWTGDSTRDPERIPVSAVETFVDLVRQALPAPLEEAELRSLAFGPVHALEQQLQGLSLGASRLWDLIEREGRTDRLLLRIVSKDGVDLVTRVGARPSNQSLRLGQPFCFDAPFERAPYTLLLQSVQGKTAIVAIESHGKSLVQQSGPHLIPSDGDIRPLVEDNDIGLHLFIVLGVRRAFPPVIVEAARHGAVLEESALAKLGTFLSGIDGSRRTIDLIRIDVRP